MGKMCSIPLLNIVTVYNADIHSSVLILYIAKSLKIAEQSPPTSGHP